MRNLYPPIKVNQELWLDVGDGHQLYIETSGNVNGIPVIYLHGGPGGGSSANHRRYFDPEKYHIILFDQRGCGNSKPAPSLKANKLDYLIKDLEVIRQYFAIDKWLVAGGSWGTTLALAYGIKHSDRVLAFILRGIFLGEQAEYDWLYSENGVAKFFPEYYREFVEHLPGQHRANPLVGYYQQLNHSHEIAAIAASKAWYLWEARISSIEHNISTIAVEDAHTAHCMALISSYYFTQGCFVEEGKIIDSIECISDIPAIIIHGRYDMVCQLSVAERLVNKWHNAQLHVLPCAGHSGFERQTIDAFCKASDAMASFLIK